MNEKPLERLNYYNGQRLEANDLKLEQEYHIRVRRWLNKSLYEPGIADGLTVLPDGGDTHQVVVGPGLALDAEGREIILLEEERVPVGGACKPSPVDGEVDGNYLTIQYREQPMAETQDGCTPVSQGQNCARLAWGGPSRVLAKPILGWSDVLPHESSGKIALGQVELDGDCNVRRVHTGVRRYVGAASQAKVRQYALEGVREIDSHNPGRIYFHVRGVGVQPPSVALYLRAERLSTLFYTELGNHVHKLTLEMDKFLFDTKHSHTLNLENGNKATATATAMRSDNKTSTDHSHKITANTGPWGYDNPPPIGHRHNYEAFALIDRDGDPNGDQKARDIWARHTDTELTKLDEASRVNMKVSEGSHDHTLAGNTDNWGQSKEITPTFKQKQLDSAGIDDPSPPDYTARSGDPLTYVANLQVYIDGTDAQHDQTEKILQQLHRAQGINWETLRLGNGTVNHLLKETGTGEIKLHFLEGVNFTEGEHFIELRVASGGGRVLYNLYVE